MGIEAQTGSAFGVSRSFSGKRWTLNDAPSALAAALRDGAALSPTLARILAARGVRASELADLLQPSIKQLLPEPRRLMNMDAAVVRVQSAIERGEAIAIFGDYDVDGSCSAALLAGFLREVGVVPRVYIPDRMSEGYGPNVAALLRLCAEGAGLLITVDCGATAVAPIAAARDAGLDIVVLDHHAVVTLPPALAQVNPNQAGDDSGLGYLCAAGVTFLFAVALNRALREAGWYRAQGCAEPDLMRQLDLVALATVCDVVPLVDANRAFVRSGLTRLARLERPGLAALCEIAKTEAPFTPYTLGFVLGPRINAGGRVGGCRLGFELLTAPDRAAALPLAAALDRHNRERQAIEAIILEEAMAQAPLQGDQPFILLAEEGWHAGVVGIVAGRLKDLFGKPALVAGFEGGEGRGSARSVPGIDIGAAVREAKDLGLIGTGGGHAMAAGFSLSAAQLDPFRAFLAAHFAMARRDDDLTASLQLDATVSAQACTLDLVAEIGRIGPFGAGNPEPVLAVSDLTLAYADPVGKDHLRLRLTAGDARLDGIAFRVLGTPLGAGLLAARGRTIHVAGRLKADSWGGKPRVQLQLEDAALAGA